MSHEDFFVGYLPKPPKADRRFFLGAGLFGLAGAGGLGFKLAQEQQSAGPGSWNQGAVTSDYTGIVTTDPFPMLRTRDIDGTPRTALLSCMTKCSVRPRLDAYRGQPVTIKGSLISRNNHAMIAVVDGPEWIADAPGADVSGLSFAPRASLGALDLKGEILDTKCWFGAMRPGTGKPHKACASLCIRAGLPPAFYVKDAARQSKLLVLVDEASQPHGPELLPFIADPVSLKGTAVAYANLLLLEAPISSIERLA
ncbi:MAG: hypothetical protein AAFQ67_00235 [Pseudomonadota bacterium]